MNDSNSMNRLTMSTGDDGDAAQSGSHQGNRPFFRNFLEVSNFFFSHDVVTVKRRT